MLGVAGVRGGSGGIGGEAGGGVLGPALALFGVGAGGEGGLFLGASMS